MDAYTLEYVISDDIHRLESYLCCWLQQCDEQTGRDQCCNAWTQRSDAPEELEPLEHHIPPMAHSLGLHGVGNTATPMKSVPKTLPFPSFSTAGAPGSSPLLIPRAQRRHTSLTEQEGAARNGTGPGHHHLVLTIYTGGSCPRRPCHLSWEAGAFHRLGALLDLVLVAAPVSCNDLACAGLYVHCGRRNSHRQLGQCPGAPRTPPAPCPSVTRALQSCPSLQQSPRDADDTHPARPSIAPAHP